MTTCPIYASQFYKSQNVYTLTFYKNKPDLSRQVKPSIPGNILVNLFRNLFIVTTSCTVATKTVRNTLCGLTNVLYS